MTKLRNLLTHLLKKCLHTYLRMSYVRQRELLSLSRYVHIYCKANIVCTRTYGFDFFDKMKPPRPDWLEFDFDWFDISIKFWDFWCTYFIFEATNFCHDRLLQTVKCKRGRNGCKKTEFFFSKHVLELYFATINNGLGEPSCSNRCTLIHITHVLQTMQPWGL